MKSDNTSLFRKPVFLLLCIAAVLDTISLSRSVLISKDSVIFIRYAQSLNTQFLNTIQEQYQHPGYPFLIRSLHPVIALWAPNSPLEGWIISAQIASMICHWVGISCFYLIARNFVRPQHAFYGALVFLCLPFPASLAINALSDWPYLMFLLGSLVFLIRAMKKSRFWDYTATGILAGLGYLVRPEAVQIVIYTCGWLALNVFLKKEKIGKTLMLSFCFLAVFSICTVPYMICKQSLFPKKNLFRPLAVKPVESSRTGLISASLLPESRALGGIFHLFQGITETLFYYYVPFAVLGITTFFKQGTFRHWTRYLVFLIILLNAAFLYLLYINYGYISRRHVLVITAFLIIFIPVGLESASVFFAKNVKFLSSLQISFCFNLLLCIGIFICIPKFFKPLGYDKAHYILIARDLKNQTETFDTVAVPDSRIGFYSERSYYDYSHHNQDYPSHVWVELLPGNRYIIHPGPYHSHNLNLPAK